VIAVCLHGDMSATARATALRSFVSSDDTGDGPCCGPRVLVATDVAARGLDVGNGGVGLVVNMSVGLTVADYVHRCGRTGRLANGQLSIPSTLKPGSGEGALSGAATSDESGAGSEGRQQQQQQQGVAVTFVVGGDEHLTPGLIKVLDASRQRVSPELREMAQRFERDHAKAVKAKGEAASRRGGEGSGGWQGAPNNSVDEEAEDQRLQQTANRERQLQQQQRRKDRESGGKGKNTGGTGKGGGGGGKGNPKGRGAAGKKKGKK
jgi:superfamily II DNA/RNA helicase